MRYGLQKNLIKLSNSVEPPKSEDYAKGVATVGGAAASGAAMTRFLPVNSNFAKKHPVLRGALYAGGLSTGGLGTRAAVDAYRNEKYKQSLDKTAADMPPFLQQDRPDKVKEIYRALKREHPEYSAEKKARIANAMGKEAEVEYRGKKFPGYNQPIDSDRPEKKKMVLAKKGDQVKLIHFGQKGYKHNYSDSAKKNYLTRSAGIRGKDGNLTANDKFSANYWARRELWPKNEPADGSARSKEKRASDENFGHKMELAGLGVLAAPAATHLAAKVPGVRAAAKPLSEFLHKNPSVEHAVELGGLGILAIPAARHFANKKKDEMKKVAYGEKEHRGLAGVTASGAKASGQARDLMIQGALATDKNIRHPWLPHTDNLHSFAGSQSRSQIGAGIAGRQQSAVSDITKSIAGAKGKAGVTGYLKSGVRGVRGLMNAGDTQHSLVDISSHYNKPLTQGTDSTLRRAIPQIGYGGGVVGGREHVNAEKLLRNATARGDGSSAIAEIDQLRPSVNPDDAQAVTRSRRFGSSTRRQVESALVAQHGMTPEQATRVADEFFNKATFSDVSKRLGTISRDAGYVRQEAGRAVGALKGAVSGLLTRGRV
jgi:hypothetical protein